MRHSWFGFVHKASAQEDGGHLLYLLRSSGGREGFGGDLKVSCSIGIKSEFNRINQWGFVEGQVVRGRNINVGIANLQKL